MSKFEAAEQGATLAVSEIETEIENIRDVAENEGDIDKIVKELLRACDEIDDAVERINIALDTMSSEHEEESPDSHRLYEAIAERRTQDAIDILADMTGESFRPASVHAHLFPDRIVK